MTDEPTIEQKIYGFTGIAVGSLIFLWFFPAWEDIYKNHVFPTDHAFFWFVIEAILTVATLFLSVCLWTLMAFAVRDLLRYLLSLTRKRLQRRFRR